MGWFSFAGDLMDIGRMCYKCHMLLILWLLSLPEPSCSRARFKVVVPENNEFTILWTPNTEEGTINFQVVHHHVTLV